MDKQGNLIQLEDTREAERQKKVGHHFFGAERFGQERFKIQRGR